MTTQDEVITSDGCANIYCNKCESFAVFGVYLTAAGYYIGTYCRCGPNTRESCEYYRSQADAYKALKENTWQRRV